MAPPPLVRNKRQKIITKILICAIIEKRKWLKNDSLKKLGASCLTTAGKILNLLRLIMAYWLSGRELMPIICLRSTLFSPNYLDCYSS